MMDNPQLSEKEWAMLRSQRKVRIGLVGNSFFWFFHLYFSHYITFPTAAFQKEIISAASDESIEHLVVMAFRGSGKSTIISTALPLWAATGQLQKKYILIVSQTQNQAQQHLKNIVQEIETNSLLRKDMWPYNAEENETGIMSIELPRFGAKIIAVSREQGVRGLRHGPHRPDLIIADDVEDSNSVKTKESRQKTYDWFTGELLPLGTDSTKFVTVGNLLHEDSLLMRLKKNFKNNPDSMFLEFPICSDNVSTWPERYPTMEAIEKLRRRIGNRVTWEREYMLRLIPDEGQLVTSGMLRFYESLPDLSERKYFVTGIDLAISERDKADYTAMVTLIVRGRGENLRLYVLPNPINKRLSFRKTLDTVKELAGLYGSTMYVESTAYQEAFIQQLEHEGVSAKGAKPINDKRSRLSLVTDKIERGVILFPKRGCEELIAQLVGFGIEKYDDLVDAFTLAILEVLKRNYAQPVIRIEQTSFWGD